MNSEIIRAFELRAIGSPKLRLREIRGCTKNEIDELESIWECSFPAAYREFLQFMGRNDGGLFSDSQAAVLYDTLLRREQREAYDEGIQDGSLKFSIPAHGFLFYARHGYRFMYFLCGEANDNPPVWELTDDGRPPWMRFRGFTNCLDAQLAEFEQPPRRR